jgi:hypothetical protein
LDRRLQLDTSLCGNVQRMRATGVGPHTYRTQ